MTYQANLNERFRRILSLGATSLLAGLLLAVLGWMLLSLKTAAAAPSSATNNATACFIETTGDNITDYSSADATALQTALDTATANALIKIAGTCAGVQTVNNFTQTVYINVANITLQGGYTTTNWTTPDPEPDIYPTALDAQGQGRVVYIATNSTITLDSLTLTGGEGNLGGGNAYGGAIRLPGGATLNLSNTVLHNNHGERGGVLNTSNGTVNLTNSLLMSNTANYRGGTLYGESSSTFNLINTLVLSNTAVQGGGLHSSHDTDITLVDSVIAYNNGSGLAGAILNFGDTLIIKNSTIHHNTTSGAGGAIYNTSGGIVQAYNSTFSNNAAGNFGAIYQASSAFTTTLVNTTIADNSATNGVGGIRLNGGVLTMSNTIMANSGSNCSLNGGSVSSGGHNLSMDATCPLTATGDLTDTNPLLDTLADNGGSTLTRALLAGSPAIDAGDNALCTAVPVNGLDQRGVTRPQNTQCDMGAYEFWRLAIGVVSASELDLTWANAAAGCTYDVYEETMPYFTPITVTYPNQSSGVVYPRLGDAATNYFYVVKAVCGGLATAVSNKVGEFDFAVVPGD